MTVNEATLKLKLSAFTIRKYIKENKLKATKVKQGLRHSFEIKQSDLDEFIKTYLK